MKGAVALKISAKPLFYAKNCSQASKSLAVGVKYKYANPYICLLYTSDAADEL